MRESTIAIFLACIAQIAFGQGGPPMITDDAGTPGNKKWENNFAVAFEHRPGEYAYDIPAIDLNYGVGDHAANSPSAFEAQRPRRDRRIRRNRSRGEMALL